MSVGVSEVAKNNAPRTSPTPDSDRIWCLMTQAEFFNTPTSSNDLLTGKKYRIVVSE
jgi:hypothetical protein